MTIARYRTLFSVILVSFLLLNYTILCFDLEPWSEYTDILEIFGIVCALVVLALAIHFHRPGEKAPWVIFLITATLFLIGDSIWSYHYHSTGQELDTPSVADFFYIANSLTCIIGILCYLLKIQRISLTRLSVDIFISIIAAAGLIYFGIVLPMLTESALSPIAVAVKISYPITDFLLLFAFFVFFFDKERGFLIRKSHFLMAISFFVMLLVDQLSLVGSIYEIGEMSFLEPIWGTAHFILGIAGLYDCSATQDDAVQEIHPLAEKVIDGIRILLPYVLTFSVMIYVIVHNNLYDAMSLWAMALFIVVSLRQIFVIMNNRRLLSSVQKSENSLNQKNIELEKLNQQVLHDAQFDFLTQLFNRRYIDQKFSQLTPKAEQIENLGLLLIDVDFFKQVNDTYGHEVGDQVLQRIADGIRSSTRANDVAGRFGGDEFIVILPGAGGDTVEKVALRLLERIRKDTYLQEKKVSLSIGGASLLVSKTKYNIKRLMKLADDALYKAKEGGRNQHVMGDCQTISA